MAGYFRHKETGRVVIANPTLDSKKIVVTHTDGSVTEHDTAEFAQSHDKADAPDTAPSAEEALEQLRDDLREKELEAKHGDE